MPTPSPDGALVTLPAMGTYEQADADLPALADREGVLADLGRVIAEAWASFDHPRPTEPQLTEELRERLAAGLPTGSEVERTVSILAAAPALVASAGADGTQAPIWRRS